MSLDDSALKVYCHPVLPSTPSPSHVQQASSPTAESLHRAGRAHPHPDQQGSFLGNLVHGREWQILVPSGSTRALLSSGPSAPTSPWSPLRTARGTCSPHREQGNLKVRSGALGHHKIVCLGQTNTWNHTPREKETTQTWGAGDTRLEAAANMREKVNVSGNKASRQLHCSLNHHGTLSCLNFPKNLKLEGQLRLAGTA